MLNNKNNIKFMNYISTPLTDDSITILYTTNNVKFDRVTLYLDFILSFLYITFDTYLGDDVMSDSDQLNHFNWCWETNIENFKKENIYFIDNKELRNYFKEFMFEIYYKLEGKENSNVNENIITLWKHIFNYKGVKSRADIDSFIDIYNIFDKSLKN
jgi:hypothetical protein